jgi:hypothetical protein
MISIMTGDWTRNSISAASFQLITAYVLALGRTDWHAHAATSILLPFVASLSTTWRVHDERPQYANSTSPKAWGVRSGRGTHAES